MPVLGDDVDVGSARFQLVLGDLSESLFEDCKGQIQRLRVVLEDVIETVVEGNVDGLNVTHGVVAMEMDVMQGKME